MNAVDSFYDLVERGRHGENSSLPIGLERFEEYIEGYSQGTSYLIGASSGCGKTTLLLYSFIYKPIMAADKEKDPYFIYFNLEMGQEQILAKLLSIYVYEKYCEKVSFREIFSRGKETKLTDEKYELIKECRPILEEFNKRIIFHDGMLNSEIFNKTCLEDLKRFGSFKDGEYKPNNPKQIVGIVVDHMSLIRGVDKKKEMDAVSNATVTLRNRCKIVSPILIMQLNRNAYGQERIKQQLQEPDESDFKDSGTMYEDSMIALVIFSPIKAKLASHRGYDINKLGSNYRSLKCLKNRFGTADVAIGLGFYGDIGIFKELPKSEDIRDWDRYTSPNWTLEAQVEKSDNVNTKFKFTM